MTTAEHAQSAKTGTCPTPDELKQYLAGWSDDSQAEQLERHLQLCPTCEAAIGQIEAKPDTLLQSLQSTVAAPVASPAARAVADRDSAAPDSETKSPPENDSPINAALAKARQLMDMPNEAAAGKAVTVWQPMQRELGVYELLRPLGRGGMGAVYLATHKQLKKQVAIKLLPVLSPEDRDVRARFDREIRVVGKLNHPSIVTATDAGEIDGTQFLVMEYVPGLDLSRITRLMGRLPVADACELMRQTALGLSCAHAEGVVHRDVKPSNLMLDESGQIRILDFGLAQLSVWDEASVELTTVGQLMGTLDYMAPEQAEVSGVDYRADLYALGATLFRLLCGRPPLAAAPNQSPFEKLRLLASHQPPKLNTLCPEAPHELATLVASLLSRNPSERPASAAHVAEDLAPFAEGSKLVDLLHKAREKAAASPETLKKSVSPDHPPLLSTALASLALRPAASGTGRSRILRRILLAATLPVLMIAGILIKLETSKGQLVIESEVDNVSVKLLSDGKPVEGIRISHGTTSTRLKADNYEISIDGPSDGLQIRNDKFILKNGQTVVARITRTPVSSDSAIADAVQPAGGKTASITFTDPVKWVKHQLQELSVELQLQRQKLGPGHPRVQELEEEFVLRQKQLDTMTIEARGNVTSSQTDDPLYDGQPLDHWIDMLSRERSVEGLKEAIDACNALVTNENAPLITETLLRVLPGLDDDLKLTVKETNSVWTLDYAAAGLLRKANPGSKYFEIWVAARSQRPSREWAVRLLNFATFVRPESSDDLKPLVDWGRSVLAALPAPSEDKSDADQATADAALLLRGFIALNSFHENQTFVDSIVPILSESPRLAHDWWISEPLVYRGPNGESRLWSLPFQQEIVRRAVSVFQNKNAAPSHVAQACMILAHGAELTAEQTASVLSAVQWRLEQAVQSADALTEMAMTPGSFTSIASPGSASESALRFVNLNVEVRRSMLQNVPVSQCSVTLQLLNLVSAIHAEMPCRPQLESILTATRDVFEIMQTQRLAANQAIRLENNAARQFALSRVELLWPDLTTDAVPDAPSQSGFGRSPSAISFKLLWGDHIPTRQDWLKYLILLHPAMQDRVSSALQIPAEPIVPQETKPV